MKVDVIRSFDAMYGTAQIIDYDKNIFEGIYSFRYNTMRCRYCGEKSNIFSLDICINCLNIFYNINA